MNRPDSPGAALPLTVYFDGACPLCRREIALYRSQPGGNALRWVNVADSAELQAADVSTPAGAPRLDPGLALARLHVRLPGGNLLSGAAAFNALWQALPRWQTLGRLTSPAPVLWALEWAYRGFLAVRPLWRPVLQRRAGTTADWVCTDDAACDPAVRRLAFQTPPLGGPAMNAAPLLASAPLDARTMADLRSDHAGETGAVWIYRGMLWVSRDAAVRRFAEEHLATESRHLSLIEDWLPRSDRSRLLPVWRVAGALTGVLPALLGPAAVYRTIEAVETFVDHHYQEQVDRLGASGEHPRLRKLLDDCRRDELHHRDDAARRLAEPPGLVARAWAWLVGMGSAAAVWVCRRV